MWISKQQVSYWSCILEFVTIFKKKWEYNEEVYQLFIDFKKVYDPVTWQVFYIILIALVSHETGNANKNVNGTYSRVWVGKNLSGVFPIRN